MSTQEGYITHWSTRPHNKSTCLKVFGGLFEGLVLFLYHLEPSHFNNFHQQFQELLECIIPLK